MTRTINLPLVQSIIVGLIHTSAPIAYPFLLLCSRQQFLYLVYHTKYHCSPLLLMTILLHCYFCPRRVPDPGVSKSSSPRISFQKIPSKIFSLKMGYRVGLNRSLLFLWLNVLNWNPAFPIPFKIFF